MQTIIVHLTFVMGVHGCAWVATPKNCSPLNTCDHWTKTTTKKNSLPSIDQFSG